MKALVYRLLLPIARKLPKLWRLRLYRWWHAGDSGESREGAGYDVRVREEVSRFSGEIVVNDLPPIFHYWSDTYLRPRLESFGYACPEDFFARQIERLAVSSPHPVRIVSIGAGNCDAELVVARLLLERGIDDFFMDCLDITDAMLERGRALVHGQGLESHFGFVHGDVNRWKPRGHYDVVIANQSLHHVSHLESLFDAIDEAIGDDGIFLASDVIGRNGHRRWPEALAIVKEFWRELPPAYRYNRQLGVQETRFQNWDNSVSGFEGVRAQDILPLAVARFGFDFFYAYGNLIDPFIDRSFGPHFDPERAGDRQFIARVQARDDAEILAGTLKPTHMLAAMRRDHRVKPVLWKHLSPAFCVRP